MNLLGLGKKPLVNKELQAKVDYFDAYRKVCEKHGFQFESVGMVIGHDGKNLPVDRMKQLSRELNSFLQKRHAKFLFDFRIVPIVEPKEPIHDDVAKHG